MQRIERFADIEQEFIERAHAQVWCNGATVDAKQRPRSRILHPVWEGQIGWLTTQRGSPKVRHLAVNPHLSLAYTAEPFKPIYVECRAVWDDDPATREHVWALLKRLPEPIGFDPAAAWAHIDEAEVGVLQLMPWRIELNDFATPPPRTLVWRA